MTGGKIQLRTLFKKLISSKFITDVLVFEVRITGATIEIFLRIFFFFKEKLLDANIFLVKHFCSE